MYYVPQPPIFAAFVGLFIAITCGTAFWNMMEQKLRDSYQDPEGSNSFKLDRLIDPALTIAYWGTGFGVWAFLGGGLLSFGFGIIPSYGVALLITIFTAGLVWDQINDVFKQLKEGGSEALSLEDLA